MIDASTIAEQRRAEERLRSVAIAWRQSLEVVGRLAEQRDDALAAALNAGVNPDRALELARWRETSS